MKHFNFFKVFIFLIIIEFSTFNSAFTSEPIVVLGYSSHNSEKTGLNNSNAFISNPNFSSKHRVKENETLGHILYSYYGKSGLNLRIVEMAIVEFNSKSFRNRNPNFLFADQNLYLPSLNEMKNLVLGKSNKKLQPEQSNNTSSHIYFFGG